MSDLSIFGSQPWDIEWDTRPTLQNGSNIPMVLDGILKMEHFGTMPFGVPNVPFGI